MYIAAGQGLTSPWGQNFDVNRIFCHFCHLLQVSKKSLRHAYQSLACETAINADFNELFSQKHIYVKYKKNAILSLIDCFFRT